jgi:YHS domain-containing protein
MQSFCSSMRKPGPVVFAYFTILIACGLPAHGQQSSPSTNTPALGQHQDPQAGKTNMDEEEVAHPFFTHMGVPEAVGVFNLRLAGLATRADGHTDGDFAFHFETGLTKYIGPGPSDKPEVCPGHFQRRRAMTNHIDPVCGMQVEEKDAAGLSEHDGVTYYFDSEECMSKFNQHPEQYADKSDK